ncbi:MAG: CvpA family protein [Rickettsiales bacterium]|nr:CvpA family protein [Rickettsiales bacterium]
MSTTFNMFDLIFVAASFIFILVAFFRGFVKELFALFNWIVTISLSYLLVSYVEKFVETYSHNKLIVHVASGSMVFVVIFIIMAFATRGLAHDWKDKMPENLDRILGVFYGAFKSLLIFGLFYAVVINFYSILLGNAQRAEDAKPKKHHELSKNKKHKESEENLDQDLPEWLNQAKCFSIIKFAGDIVNPLVSKAIDNMETNLLDEIKPIKINSDDAVEDVIDGENGVGDDPGGNAGALSDNVKTSTNALSKKSENSVKTLFKKKPSEKYDDTGYSKKEIEKMNRLIEIVN